MALTKSQITEAVHERVLGFNYQRKKSVETVEILLEIIKRTLENGEDVLISGFGKFCVREDISSVHLAGPSHGRAPDIQ